MALPAQAGLFTAVYAFGDSLSDAGDLGLMPNRPAPRPPEALGYIGGRFSNGPVAAEVLAAQLGVPLASYAVGGAMTGTGNADVADTNSPEYSTGMRKQVDQYLSNVGGNADAQGLYLVFGGSNDFLHLFETNPGASDTDFNDTAIRAIDNLVAAVTDLYRSGARSFLLPLLPDIGAAPGVADASVSAAIADVNVFLAAAYQQLLDALADPSVSFVVFDTFASQRSMSASFANTATACMDLDNGIPCDDATGFFFLDDLHPTASVHARIGSEFLSAVPEPAHIALLGLGLLAVQRRRRTTRALAIR
ncbi:MAG: SGNH/GDSL hydrolase family protein [Rubrivivax sp.]